MRIAINGLGRIGRCILRALVEYDFNDLEIIAANGPAAISDHAHLLKYDSVHGTFNQEIKIDNNYLQIANRRIQITHEREPAKLPWKELGVDLVLECSGRFNSKELALKHIEAGAKNVIVSAPCDNADNTIVLGVNQQMLKASDQVISIGSCTTNALAPIAKILNDTIGIENGFMTTIHSYTNDQNILDGSHKDLRRARSAAVSMVPTSTGAAKAIGLVLPELDGKIAGSAIRVPTPNVSLIDLCFIAKRSTTKDEINNLVKNAAETSFKNIVEVAPTKLVSVDFNHNPHSSIFDPYETSVVDGNLARVISWYDNEWGFSVRMLDIARLFTKL